MIILNDLLGVGSIRVEGERENGGSGNGIFVGDGSSVLGDDGVDGSLETGGEGGFAGGDGNELGGKAGHEREELSVSGTVEGEGDG